MTTSVNPRVEFRSLYNVFDGELPQHCQNCNSTEDLEIHHIVPLAVGGNNTIGNLVRLCVPCHEKIHGGNTKRRQLTQAGKEKARKNNPEWREGRPKRKLTPQYMQAIELLKDHTYKEVVGMTGISESTLQRIRRQHAKGGEQ